MTVHFSEFNMGENCTMVVTGKDTAGGKKQQYEMTGLGKMDLGEFWTQHVKGDTIDLKVKCKNGAKAKDDAHFVVDKLAVGYAVDESSSNNIFGSDNIRHLVSRRDAICGQDDKQNAACYETSHPMEYERGRAVARLLISGSSLCTGWLASANNHLVTNEHCITSATAARNTDYEFMAEASTCGGSNCQLCHAGDVYSGAAFIQDNANLDYCLVQIDSGDPASVHGYLQIDDRAASVGTTVVGEEIYILQHPGGRAKEFGMDTGSNMCIVDSRVSACGGSGYQDVGCEL